ncbi:Hypothetical protein HVR_LOCUS504 [uncultured virus]|nr:Hypothetical protein HVR_LOCUS504 [uncultured virus]
MALTLQIIPNIINLPSRKERINKYTLEIFIRRAHELHGDKFDYGLITEQDINNNKSKIKIICKKCAHISERSITDHIDKLRGCLKCNKRIRWNYDRFISEASATHEDKYIYYLTPNEKITCDSHIDMRCRNCQYKWAPTIDNHINKASGCPQCFNVAPWTYDRLITRATEIHGNKYDYSLIPQDITGAFTIINIICTICGYKWPASIDNHINAKSGCPNCVNLAPWTYENFIIAARETHANRYNYSEIDPECDINCKCKFPVTCNKCSYKWYIDITHHIGRKQGCPTCSMSQGELACGDILTRMGITYLPQFSIKTLPYRRYDFMFVYNNIRYLLEYDGRQHFEYINFFFIDEDEFKERQLIDIIKTQKALNEGYRVIRIDYKQIDIIKYHIEKALSSNATTYFSDETMYTHIISKIAQPKFLSLAIQR